jgi:hypothetical protein
LPVSGLPLPRTLLALPCWPGLGRQAIRNFRSVSIADAVNTAINQLFVVLERKKAEMHTYQNHNYTIQGMKKASVNELGNIEEVMRLYNTAVEPYLGMKTSLTQATKNQLLSSIRKIMPTITYLVNRLRAALDELQ